METLATICTLGFSAAPPLHPIYLYFSSRSMPRHIPSKGASREQPPGIEPEEKRSASGSAPREWREVLGGVVKQAVEVSVAPYAEHAPIPSAVADNSTARGRSAAQPEDSATDSVGDGSGRAQNTQNAKGSNNGQSIAVEQVRDTSGSVSSRKSSNNGQNIMDEQVLDTSGSSSGESSSNGQNIVDEQVQDTSGGSNGEKVGLEGTALANSGEGAQVDDRSVSSGRTRARVRWTKIKMHREFLVKKTRRQVPYCTCLLLPSDKAALDHQVALDPRARECQSSL